MWGIVAYVTRINGKWMNDEKIETWNVGNLKSWKLEKSTDTLIKRHLSLIGGGKKNMRV